MRKTLRRSCDACAKSKLRCDLFSPQCTRCDRKGLKCVYANEPLSSNSAPAIRRTSLESEDQTALSVTQRGPSSIDSTLVSFDPFDSYPRTRLPRVQVQQLMQHFLSNIAFQYYPLDLDAKSNPFVVSWWPLALADPALFHVSLQTASLDIELRAQKGFTTSDLLMADSVSLVRSRIQSATTALQDETLDSVVTLAAIEYGKGNIDTSKVHIDGIKSIVKYRGGIGRVKLENPLTARMVSWVTLVLSQSPQFGTQDDFGKGDGIIPIRQWLEAADITAGQIPQSLQDIELDSDITAAVVRLQYIFSGSDVSHLSTTDLHDLACFILHKLLARFQEHQRGRTLQYPSTSESFRYATALYMFILHGPSYFSHSLLQDRMINEVKTHLEDTISTLKLSHPVATLWLVSVGLVASGTTPQHEWFVHQSASLVDTLDLYAWSTVESHLKSVLWLDTPRSTSLFQQCWNEVWATYSAFNT